MAFSDEIYAIGNRIRDKHQHALNTATGPLTQSAFGSVKHEAHKVRRAALSRYFSRQQMLKLEPSITALIKKFCAKMLRQTEPFDAAEAYGCLTGDIISEYAFGDLLGFIDQPHWTPNFKGPSEAFVKSVYLFRFLPPLRWISELTPYLSTYLVIEGEIGLLLREMFVNIPARVQKAIDDVATGNEKSHSVFREILKSNLPDSEKTIYRLSGDGFSLMIGGTETTAV